MATLEHDSSSGRYRVRFRYGGRAFKRTLKTRNEKEAEGARARVDETIRLLERGRLVIPPGADPGVFIVSDGNLSNKPVLSKPLTLEELLNRSEASIPEGAKEANTRTTEKLHAKHLKRILGGQVSAQGLTLADLQRYCDQRAQEKGKRGLVRPQTIKKELDTFRAIWNWAVSLGLLSGPVPIKGVRLPKASEQMPFQTWEEVNKIIDRGGLTSLEERALWDRVFLTVPQIAEILEFVRSKARRPVVHPMFVFIAMTGARRSEMMRSRIEDIDFQSGTVLIREKKRDKSKTLTYRRVPMPDLLIRVMKDWLDRHPGGVHTFCLSANQKLKQTFTTKTFRRALKGSKWERLRGFHTFRHSFASNLAAAGVDQRVIDELMGHQTDAMRHRYRHLFPDQRQKAVQSVFAGVGQ
jgi:integrase